MPNRAEYQMIFAIQVAVTAVVGEMALTFWLLIKGVNVKRWEKRVEGLRGRAKPGVGSLDPSSDT